MKHRLLTRLAVLSALLAMLAVTAPSALAQEAFTFTAEFYHIVHEAGKSVKVDLKLTNQTAEAMEVEVELVETPGEDWSPRLMGRITSFEVRRVLVLPDDPAQLKVIVDIPDEAAPGDYPIVVRAVSADGRFEETVRVVVTVKGATEQTDQVDLEARFPFLQGPTGAIFEFSVTVRNRASDPVTLDMGALVPQGWSAAFKPSFEEKFLTSVSLEGNRSQNLVVQVTSPLTAAPGQYPIRVSANTGLSEVTADLGVVLTGTTEVRLGTATDRLNAKIGAGDESPISLVLLNTGTGVLRRVDLIAQTPQGWVITFDPGRVEEMQPEQIQQVTARVTPPGDAIPGDYSLVVLANAAETSDTLELRITVTQSSVWGWVGLAIVLVVVAGLGGLFFRLGRR